MGRALLDRLKQSKPLGGAVEEATVNLLLAAGWLEDGFAGALEPEGLTLAQFNVLRILRGVHPEGHPRCEIAVRLIHRAPDVTRLIDRLVRAGLVKRGRGVGADRRQSVARITAKGIAVLERANACLEAQYRQLRGRLEPRDWEELSRLSERLWSEAGR